MELAPDYDDTPSAWTRILVYTTLVMHPRSRAMGRYAIPLIVASVVAAETLGAALATARMY